MKIKQGVNRLLSYQVKLLKEILLQNKKLIALLQILDDLGIPDCYVAAGCINQTVLNYLHGYEIDYGIGDYDVVYYDPDTSYEAEDIIIKRIESKASNLGLNLDIKNQARVPLWYGKKFGHDIDPYNSVEEAINRWGTTITCVGVKMHHGKLDVYAPYGLNDLFSMILRPVKIQFIKKDYDKKTKKWKDKWPLLTVIPWEENDEKND